MMTATTPGTRLREYLSSDGTTCGVPASDDQISDFELRTSTTIPDDLRAYFREVNGTVGDYAYGIIRFFSIDEVRSLAEEWEAKRHFPTLIHSRYSAPIEGQDRLFVFADHMHEAQLYAIRLSPTDNRHSVMILDGGKPEVIAESFADFVNKYLSNPAELRLMVG